MVALRLTTGTALAGLAAADLSWSDWDRRQVCHPFDYSVPENETEVVSLLKKANSRGEQVKVVGSGHSFSSIALTDGHMLSLDRMNKILHVNGTAVRLQGGIRLYDLNDQLEKLGLSLPNLGATCEQSFAGVTATATHGTGNTGNVATAIEALRIVMANGTIVEASKDDADTTLFNAARVGLGSLGVITELTVRTLPLFKLKLTNTQLPLDELLPKLPDLLKKYERLQWYWNPPDETATLVTREVTDEPLTEGGCWEQPMALKQALGDPEALGSTSAPCIDVSYKAMCGSREHYHARHLYTEMELFVPVEKVLDAIADFRAFQDKVLPQHNSSVPLFTGVRYVEPDDIMLSTASGRATAVISFIVMGPSKEEAGDVEEFARYAQELEHIAETKYGGRPHWGKKNWATKDTLRKAYGDETWSTFLKLRAEMDPKGIFLNDYLKARLPLELGPQAQQGATLV